MNLVRALVDKTLLNRKRIAVVGDAMIDEWVHGDLDTCQDGCFKMRQQSHFNTPGGAANAARQLQHWNVSAFMFSATGCYTFSYANTFEEPCNGTWPIKRRFIGDNGRIWFRHDKEKKNYGLSDPELREIRDLTVKAVRTMQFDAVLLVDYDKGFLDDPCIRAIIAECRKQKIPCVADAKRSPEPFAGAILKVNAEYDSRYGKAVSNHWPAKIVTYSGRAPVAIQHDANGAEDLYLSVPCRAVSCVNHVGAGDCFGAHLTLALAHGLEFREAAIIAHSAGRVYVQYPHSRPPWPHEITRDLDPVGGKILASGTLAALRQSISGRIVFTNGVFRIPHAGHAWLFDWAKKQGNILVVGINDDESANRLRPGEFVLPLYDRLHTIASQAAVDYVFAFAEDDPCSSIKELRPDILVKGHEYVNNRVPGDDMVGIVRFAPPDLFPNHSTSLIACLQDS